MSKENSSNSGLKLYGLSFVAGVLLSGAMTYGCQFVKRQRRDEILDHVKALFLREGPIEGAWIEQRPAQYSDNQRHTKAYFGGITRQEDDGLQQYEFAADTATGELLDVYKI
ncbi:hypothetical protein JCM14202_1499 [Agrilactobacillus composti DSM 18527 = JCM 14202]|uniref:hypothetical protein n=1 Tax=Agrilactobacillus composti TaxID=398555 RepID=UPI00042DFBE8|nr:hypothetical protein [Agrilactobacillus composti]GAF39630.1 hypothetical protein JCM14202_1499 [Agrilactobacillus composti DSM 18527 = JCM 14202]